MTIQHLTLTWQLLLLWIYSSSQIYICSGFLSPLPSLQVFKGTKNPLLVSMKTKQEEEEGHDLMKIQNDYIDDYDSTLSEYFDHIVND